MAKHCFPGDSIRDLFWDGENVTFFLGVVGDLHLGESKGHGLNHLVYPIPSMYGIFTYIWLVFLVKYGYM